jgi:hypothetical protein
LMLEQSSAVHSMVASSQADRRFLPTSTNSGHC